MKSTYMGWKKLASSALSAAVIVQMMVPAPTLALFGGKPKIPSATQVAREMEQRYHINQSAVQEVGEAFNVSGNKKTPPEVSIFFSPTDPKEGEKIIARAFPILFSNPSDQLYYTWYLKRKGCDLGSAASAPGYCNADGSGGITVNDWKVAAARIIATDGADKAGFSYVSDTDSDGYRAEYGGNNQVNTTNDWCYMIDSNNGSLYELISSSTSQSFSCPSGYTAACVYGTDTINPGTINSDPYVATSDETFGNTSEYYVAGTPSCSGSTASCPSPMQTRCVDLAIANTTFTESQYSSQTSPLSSCSGGSISQKCVHLFPRTSATGPQFGDSAGTFGAADEFFWGTNPNDADTADNGNKDEANVVGLGQETFEWNYQAGDQLGVVVEGTSIMSTKHDDSSYAIMWAFSKNDCPVLSKGSYSTTIRGYSVNIPTTTMSEDDINACLPNNLVDPLQGGQGKSQKLEVSVAATPENPTNDQTAEKTGDVVTATASLTNSSRPIAELLYTWKVEVSDNPVSGFTDITADLVTGGMLGASSGNGLDSIVVALNMGNAFLTPLGLSGVDPLYLRLGATVQENFSSGVQRVGKSDVIVRASNTTKKVVAYSTSASLNAVTGKYRVSATAPICNTFYASPATAAQAMENLNKIACRVVNGEIVAVEIDPSGFADFSWTLNGIPLTCTDAVSGDGACAAGNRVFFAAVGSVGETYTLQVNATNTATGKSATLARTFQIVAPEILMESTDTAAIWPKYLGDYTALDGATFADYSESTFEKYAADNIKMRARFIPSFVGSLSTRAWSVDGEPVTESAPFEIDYAPSVTKGVGDLYNVSLSASLIQPEEKRFALRDIWGITALASAEVRVTESIQAEVTEPETLATAGPKRFFAAVSSYLPASVLFSFKLIATMALLLFTVGFVFSLAPETVPTAQRRRGRRME